MMTCPACSGAVPESGRFCPACGEPIASVSGSPTRTTPYAAAYFSSSDAISQGRFVPGSMLAGRYRIVGLLGRGGMGEVYRADDLKLAQPVALKFLPEALAADPDRLARFLNEVRLARQVSHPNVCRVYDIGEADSQHFLSMEYIDGEDMSSLLRRIGRLPQDKSVEIARQLCAGLSAAHERGVLHRDLKPANIMIDGRGKVRITDFGLAGIQGSVRGMEVRAGTPGYMSPEQLSGREVTVRSDIYCLGLVLYEIFTGKTAFKADSLAELVRAREASTPATPGSIVGGLDPAVERVILRCLEKEPSARPVSALAVAAAMPGGDPLAAALAAGETPSPQMVADAAVEGGLRPLTAWICLLALIVGVLAHTILYGRLALVNIVPMEKSPELLAERARDIVGRLGHTAPAVDTRYGFEVDEDYLEHVESRTKAADRWNQLSTGMPPAIYFWYRQSPVPMVSKESFAVVSRQEPGPTRPGMATVLLDPRGHLIGFFAVPPEQAMPQAMPQASPSPADWSVLFRESGLDAAAFTPVESEWRPAVYADSRAAWKGSPPGRPDLPLRLEAASLDGRIVSFRGVADWTQATPMTPPQEAPSRRVVEFVYVGMRMVLIVCAIVLARRNLRLGRGDRAGAFKCGLFYLIVHLVVWSLWASHVPNLNDEWVIFTADTGWTLFHAVILWLIYVALEPYVRRLWPDTIISWNRLLAGRLRDPLVGRDLLVGCLIGTGSMLVLWAGSLALPLIGLGPPRPPIPENFLDLNGLLPSLADVLDLPLHALLESMGAIFLLLLLRVVVRVQWIAAALFVLITGIQVGLSGENPVPSLVINCTALCGYAFVLTRFGLLAGTASSFCVTLMKNFVVTTNLSAWYAGGTILGLGALLGLAIYGFHTALGGRPVFKGFAPAMLRD